MQKPSIRLGLSIVLLVHFATGCAQPANSPDTDTTAARDFAGLVISDAGGQLKGALSTALSEQGPVGAVEVCQLQAPAIGAAVGDKHSVTVRRVTTRARNPANAADPWQEQQLAGFERAIGDGASPADIDVLDAQTAGGETTYRYMRPIMAEPLCLTCHGAKLPEALAQTIDQRYPEDRARGYSAGDLRGAFFVSWTERLSE